MSVAPPKGMLMRSHEADSHQVAQRSWQDAYVANYPDLVRLAAFLLGSAVEGEDAVQELWLNVSRSRKDQTAIDSAAAYLRRALVNVCRSQQRKSLVRRRHLATQPDPDRDVPDAYQRVFDEDAITKSLRKLPRRVREVLVLRFYGDLTVAATAEVLGISSGAVKRYTSEGLASLGRILGEEETS